jgi:hypothetical protein
MKNSRIIITLFLTIATISLYAQRHKNAIAKKNIVPVVEVDPKTEAMLASTQQILFVDSVIVDKQDFLNAFLVNPEVGSLQMFNTFFNSDSQPFSSVYVNQFGNKCFYAENGRLYTADLLGTQWSQPTELQGLGDYSSMNYPFMLSDGITFYFAAISDEGLGGLDIYMSRYDADNGSFLRAENIGMPFNSNANDYMYVIDELDSIGFFATDRRQPKNKVCIYTFVPNTTRRTYSSDEHSDDFMRSRAAIERIADTWGNGKERKKALQRISMLQASIKAKNKVQQNKDFYFPIDDNHVYTSMNDFRDADNKSRMKELLNLKKRLQQLLNEIDKARRYYAKAIKNEREVLKSELLDYEQEQTLLETQIRQKEKNIRNAEIRTFGL